jgi:glycosyltransferase involved in cell wall biosynthesis
MKIFFAIKSLDNISGGAERVLADVTHGLAERGYDVSVLTCDPYYASSFYSLHPNVTLINLGIGKSAKKATLRETLHRVIALRRYFVQNNPDVVIGFMHSMYIPLGIALAGTKVPLIASEHIVFEHYKHRPIEYLLLQLTPYLTKKMTVISEKVRSGFNSHLKKHMTVIPNPVCIPVECRADVVGLSFSRKSVLSVGRLSPQKDHKTLIDAFALLADDFPEWDLRIVGEGELRSELEGKITMLKLQERIELVGTKQKVSEEYFRAQLFVMPSLYESFGLATAEALAHGLPVLGFADCPGTNELIKHEKNGILVQGADRVTCLADGLRRLMSAPNLRQLFGNAGPNSMAEFSKESICHVWEELLRTYAQNASMRDAAK